MSARVPQPQIASGAEAPDPNQDPIRIVDDDRKPKRLRLRPIFLSWLGV
jgi:hypothetical protein